MSEQSWNFIKKENLAQVFIFDFYKIFLEHLLYITFLGTCSIVITWIANFLKVFFLLTYLICIYWSFGSLCRCFCFTSQVVTIIQIVLTLTKFVLYICSGFELAVCNSQFAIALWCFVSALSHFFWKLWMVNNVLQLFLCIFYKIGSFKTQLTCVFVLQLKAHNFVFYMLTTEKTLRC